MADAIIPRLDQLGLKTYSIDIPTDFVKRFHKLHNEDRKLAEKHWERLVARVLNTDAVEADATRRRAINQAVAATVMLLERTDLRMRCPECAYRRRQVHAPLSWWRR